MLDQHVRENWVLLGTLISRDWTMKGPAFPMFPHVRPQCEVPGESQPSQRATCLQEPWQCVQDSKVLPKCQGVQNVSKNVNGACLFCVNLLDVVQ